MTRIVELGITNDEKTIVMNANDKRLVHRLQKLGYEVPLQPAAHIACVTGFPAYIFRDDDGEPKRVMVTLSISYIR